MAPHRPFESYLRSMTKDEILNFSLLPLPLRMAVRSAWDRGELEADFQHWREEQSRALSR